MAKQKRSSSKDQLGNPTTLPSNQGELEFPHSADATEGEPSLAVAADGDEEALSPVSSSEAFAEFGDYDTLEDDDDDAPAPRILRAGAVGFGFAEDEDEDEDGQEAEELAAEDEIAGEGADQRVDGEAALLSPKERQLAAMRLEARIEAIVFAAKEPLKTVEILALLADPGLLEEHVQTTLDQLVEFYETREGGFRLHYLKRIGYQFQTSQAAAPIMERMFASRPRPISRAALETLAILAYRQPVTRAEVEFIRGVDAGSIFKTLLERDLIKCVGRKEIVGRPMLFGTTDAFLKVFNLSSVKDLPPLESFQPAREMVQGALDKIEEGDALIDVEEYIADNTGGEYEDDGLELALETKDGSTQDSEMAIPDGDSVAEGSRDLDQ